MEHMTNNNITFADIKRAAAADGSHFLSLPAVEQAGARQVDGKWTRLYVVMVTEREHVKGPIVGITTEADVIENARYSGRKPRTHLIGKPKRGPGSERTVTRFQSEPMAWDALCAFLSGSRVQGNPMHAMSDGGAVDLSFDDQGASQMLDDGYNRYTERLSGEAGFRKEMMMSA